MGLEIFSVSVGGSLISEVHVADPSCFRVDAELRVQAEGRGGVADYWLTVCSHEWLAAELLRDNRPKFMRGYLVVPAFDIDLIYQEIERAIVLSRRDSVEDSVIALSRYFLWEFDGSS